MPLPNAVAQRIRDQIDVLLNKAKKEPIGEAEYISLRNQYVSLVKFLSGNSSQYELLIQDLMHRTDISGPVLIGFIDSLKRDFQAGRFDSLTDLIAADNASDYLRQAKELLKEGQLGTCDHVPAAVVAGAVLENALRRICQRQNPAIEILQPNGQHKMLNGLILDLAKANVFEEPNATQLLAWKDIRNAAVHGQFHQFTGEDVKLMIDGVKQFLADYG